MNRRSCVLKRIGILPDLFCACVQRLLKVFNYAAGRRKNMNHENINHADLKLFREKFRPLYAAVKDSGFCRQFAAKKYRHSVQVLTIGRKIAARDEQLKKEDAAFHALGEKALLFHDVGRFMEVYEMYRNNAFADHGSWFSKRCDHGLLSYEMMKNEPGYNDVRILAALKHHGHMMEEFYADPEFQDVADPETGRQLLAILFWVRDADKLANFYIQRYEDNLRKDPFFVTMSEEVRRAPLKIQFFLRAKRREVCRFVMEWQKKKICFGLMFFERKIIFILFPYMLLIWLTVKNLLMLRSHMSM